MKSVVIELTPKQLEETGVSPAQTRRNGKLQLRLTEKQLLKAIGQLPPEAKIRLKNQLDIELKPLLDKRRAEFVQAVKEIQQAYKDIPPEEVEKDVAQAVAEVRAQKYAKRRG